MTVTVVIMMVVAVAAGAVLLQPSLTQAAVWRATITPLASIIGSGFLVATPILAHAFGSRAWLAMTALCLVAYLFGFAIRRNIALVEPLIAAPAPPPIVAGLEHLSGLALAMSYFISVTYYLNLLAAFALRGAGIVDPVWTSALASVLVLALATIGVSRGLRGLEAVEVITVGLKLSLIAGLIASLAYLDIHTQLIGAGTPTLQVTGPAMQRPPTAMHEIGVLLGLVILVQGFETSRYLGAEYDARLRVRSMRYAQWLSMAIYIAFIILATPLFRGPLPLQGGETAIIDILLPLGAAVVPVIIATAIASQLSAAVADMNGAGGLLSVATGGRLSVRTGYLATALVALAITWSSDIFEIILYASKSFVLYYALQCLLAAYVASLPGRGRNRGLVALFASATLLAGLILGFGLPASV